MGNHLNQRNDEKKHDMDTAILMKSSQLSIIILSTYNFEIYYQEREVDLNLLNQFDYYALNCLFKTFMHNTTYFSQEKHKFPNLLISQ